MNELKRDKTKRVDTGAGTVTAEGPEVLMIGGLHC